jgi:hypothetical protein
MKRSGCEVEESEAVGLAQTTSAGEEVVAISAQDAFVKVSTWTEDLSDRAFNELTGSSFLDLVADSHFASGTQQSCEITRSSVKRDAAHGGRAAFGESDVQDLRACSSIVEEHFLEIAESKKQKRVTRQLTLDALVLQHHGCEL